MGRRRAAKVPTDQRNTSDDPRHLGFGTPLVLDIPDPSRVNWIAGALEIRPGFAIGSPRPQPRLSA
jgi:hypothetical protein